MGIAYLVREDGAIAIRCSATPANIERALKLQHGQHAEVLTGMRLDFGRHDHHGEYYWQVGEVEYLQYIEADFAARVIPELREDTQVLAVF